MATGTLPTPIVNCSTRTSLINETIAKSSDSSWHTATHTLSISGYKYIRVFVYVVGAMRNTNWIPVDGLALDGDENWTTVYWDSYNMGNLAIDRNGTVNVSAKTRDYPFSYQIVGYK